MTGAREMEGQCDGRPEGAHVPPATPWGGSPLSLVRAMASACGLDGRHWEASERAGGVAVRVVDRAFLVVAGDAHAALEIERVAEAFAAATAFQQARMMMAAAAVDRPPLWLVRGSPALAAYLRWSATGARLAEGLALSPGLDGAPVLGGAVLRVRRGGRAGSARLLVRRGTATGVAVLGVRPRSTITFASGPRLTVAGTELPATVGLGVDVEAGAVPRPLEELVDHPFVRGAGLRVRAIQSARGFVEIALEGGWTTLAPVPAAASRAMPPDAEPPAPWRLPAGARVALDRLVAAGALGFGPT